MSLEDININYESDINESNNDTSEDNISEDDQYENTINNTVINENNGLPDEDLDNIDLVNTNPNNYQNYNNKGQESNIIKEKIKNIKPYKFEEDNYLKVFKISNNDEIIHNLSSFSSKALYRSHQSFNKNLTFYNCVVDENAYFYKFFKDIVLKYIS